MRTIIASMDEPGGEIPLARLARETAATSAGVELPFDYQHDTWILAKDSMRFLTALVRRLKPRKVIEFGSGVSTRVLAHELRGTVIRSFDHVATYAARTRATLGDPAADVKVLHRPIGLQFFNGKLLPFYRLRRDDYGAVRDADLVLADGPPGAWGREAVLYSVFPAMREGALLVLDDASRPGEVRAVRAWQRFFGGALEVHALPEVGNGLLLARKSAASAQGRQFELGERCDSMRHSLRAIWRHRPRALRWAPRHG